MELSLFESCRKKKLLVQFGIWLSAISVFYAAVFTPLFHVVSSNVLLINTVYPLLLDFGMQFLNYLFYWCSFAYVVYAFFRFGWEKGYAFLVIYAIVVLLRYPIDLIAGFCMTGIPTADTFLFNYLPYLLIDIGMDLLLMLGLVLVLRTIRNKQPYVVRSKRGKVLRSNLPFSRMFDLKNPVQRAAFWAALIPACVQLLSRVLFDLAWGAPAGLTDLLWMITYYALDVVYALIGFFVIVLWLNRFYFNEEKARMEYEQPLPNDPV